MKTLADGSGYSGETGRWPAEEQKRALLAAASAAIVLTLSFSLCFQWQWWELWQVWTTNSLRSFGMAIPLASLVLCLRAWRMDDWAHGGSWWGLPLLLGSVVLGLLTGSNSLLYLVSPSYDHLGVVFLPLSLLITTTASGTVLLFGGEKAWRRAWFPLLLLLALNPVPSFFQALVDLPMQHLAAHSARGFAALLNIPVSDGTLKMMFTPKLGMFIAPGCNGLRGAVTMGYMALVLGYLYRLRWARWVAYVALSVLVAYLFNFLRLNGVVIYYWFALHFPAIADSATLADYLIGGVLFFLAALFLFSVPRRWQTR